jgi:hypothetical protein
MQKLVSNQRFVAGTLGDLVNSLSAQTDEVQNAISIATATTDSAVVEQQRQELLAQFTTLAGSARGEDAPGYAEYVSRFDGVGLFQSVLAKLFQDFPDLQGYGDKNFSWVLTPIEEVAHAFKGFFSAAFKDVHGEHKPLLQAVIEAWKSVNVDCSPYPEGLAQSITFPDADVTISLLADWGGDNPAARNVAEVVRRAQPQIAIHLGDIYYGGVKEECESFLRLWPLQADPAAPGAKFLPGSSYALNGNHEMYSGGESYFKVVLTAFGQPQPFFCLQNQYWRLIGLDTAYAQGRLRMTGPYSDGISRQWKWLVGLLKLNDGRANILLTHHQPVSAHSKEYGQSQGLRDDVTALFETEGVPKDAIFGWFFGHEHRAAIYDDKATLYNARLIGSGCIPHLKQDETACDPGCTPFVDVNARGEYGTLSAISMCTQLTFIREYLTIVYVDEDNTSWGYEQWNSKEGRLGGTPFTPNKSTFTS